MLRLYRGTKIRFFPVASFFSSGELPGTMARFLRSVLEEKLHKLRQIIFERTEVQNSFAKTWCPLGNDHHHSWGTLQHVKVQNYKCWCHTTDFLEPNNWETFTTPLCKAKLHRTCQDSTDQIFSVSFCSSFLIFLGEARRDTMLPSISSLFFFFDQSKEIATFPFTTPMRDQ